MSFAAFLPQGLSGTKSAGWEISGTGVQVPAQPCEPRAMAFTIYTEQCSQGAFQVPNPGL